MPPTIVLSERLSEPVNVSRYSVPMQKQTKEGHQEKNTINWGKREGEIGMGLREQPGICRPR
jgi:hypothetical protein